MELRKQPPAYVPHVSPDPALYPFRSRWFESSVGPVHYLDEGEGPVLLLLHGNPDWTFLFRKIIPALREHFRVIAPDYPGYGLSPHPEGYSYQPGAHSAVVQELVAALDLRDLVVMGSDWGGPIGMDVASREPERVRALVMGNTFFWPDASLPLRFFSSLMASRPMQWLIREKNFMIEGALRMMVQAPISRAELDQYRAIWPTPASREGLATLPASVLSQRDWLAALEQRVLRTLSDKPVLLTFGDRDPVLARPEIVQRWQRAFPQAETVHFPDAGHFFQEDAPEALSAAVIETFSPNPPAPRPEMPTPAPRIPTWLNAMTVMVVLSNLLVFGLYAFAVPTGIFPDVDAAAEYPVRFFAIRHIAIAFPLLHGLIKQNRDVLTAMYHMFLVIAVLDVGSILYFGWSYPFLGPLPLAVNALIGTMVFIGPMALGTWALHRK